MRWLNGVVCVALLSPLVAAGRDQAGAWREPATGMEFVSIPAGCFQMGNEVAVHPPEAEHWTPRRERDSSYKDELPRHEVCLDAFWMGRYEVRAADWALVMGAPSKGRGDVPMAGVSWEQARAFAARLTAQAGGKFRFRLPTEAEWEYACRAGASSEIVPRHDELVKVAWYSRSARGEPQPVGKLPHNAFGLHDMLGNVWEWVEDSYLADGYARHELYNPRVEAPGKRRVIRGASFRSQPPHLRCGQRSFYDASDSLDTIGFRLVRTP